MWKEYLFAESLGQALDLLAAREGRAQLIAGGTDLFLQSQHGECPAQAVIDITRIPNLGGIEEREGYVVIGALARHAQITASPLIREKAPILALACGCVGGPQTRNAGTLVGNVINAQPAADGAVGLFTLDAELEVASPAGRRWEPISAVYRGVGKCNVDACREMVTAIRFRPLGEGWGCGYQRLARRRALTLPTLIVAATVQVREGRIAAARIAVGPVGPVPFRARDAEALLLGQAPDAAVLAQAGELAAAKSGPRDSILRGSGEYRKAMVAVLVRRALASALEVK